MPFLHTLVHHPRKLFLRRALFQVHLWTGILLSLYVVVIALTGAILVFEDELTATTLPAHLAPYDAANLAAIPAVVRSFDTAYPGAHINYLYPPSPVIPAYQLRATDSSRHEFNLVADPVTAAIYLQPRTWVNWTHDLHVYLLLGSAHGEQFNGVGAAILLLLSLTGIIIWWAGLKNWTRGLKFSLRHNWRRINFDLHNCIGFWTLFIVLWWSISGIYFAWYRQVGFVVSLISPLRGMVSPTLPPLPPSGTARASLESIVAAAQQASPHGHLFGIGDLSPSERVVYAQMDLRAPGDFSHRDIVTVDTANAHVLTIWHYGANHTLGDWIMWSMHPLHFGTLWGIGFKILWFLFGFSLAVLSVTGLIMYWNRYLRHRISPTRRPA